MANLETYIPIVEEAIQKIGVAPETARTEIITQWALKRGSADVIILLRTSNTYKGPRNILIITAPIMKLPSDELQQAILFKQLLELSHSALIETFTIFENAIYLKTTRFVDGMDSSEILDMLDSLSYTADFIDDKLKKRFDVTDFNFIDDSNNGSRS